MRIPLDDEQYARHAMGQMADFAAIVNDELRRAGFDDRMRSKMVLIWWSSLISSAFSPNLVDLINLIQKEGEEEG